MLLRPRRPSLRTLYRGIDALISRIGGIVTRFIRGIPRDVAVEFMLFYAVRSVDERLEEGTCGCAMQVSLRGRRVVRFSNGLSLMIMESRFGLLSQLSMRVLL